MITVVREMAHRVATELAHMERPRLDEDATDEEQNEALAEVLEQALEAAQASVERGPELLPILREHGVVDAGGYGVTLLIAGVIAGLRGAHDEIPEVAHHAVELQPHGPEHESSAYRYCTNFVVSGGGLAPGRTWVSLLEDIGDSVLVVGDATTLRVHVHTDDPETAVAVFGRAGTVERLDVADMHEQQEQRAARLATGASRPAAVAVVRCGVVAVAAGAGMRRLYEQLGAHVIEGGSTLNPSTFELLAGIHEVAADEVVVLPNSANVILAAERAAELSEKDVAVVESRWPQAGLAVPRRARPRPRARGERAAAARRARRDPDRRGGAGRARRQAGPLQRGRRGRLRRRGDGGLGGTGGDAAGGAGGARRRIGAPDLRERRRRPARRRRRSSAWPRRPSRSSATPAGSRTTGGCWPPSERRTGVVT